MSKWVKTGDDACGLRRFVSGVNVGEWSVIGFSVTYDRSRIMTAVDGERKKRKKKDIEEDLVNAYV